MGFVSELIRPQISAYAPDHDYWYNSVGVPSLTGVPVTADSAMKVSAVWACVGAIAGSLSSIPLPILERLPEGGSNQATDYYLYDVIHDQPNRSQTSIEWREMMNVHALQKGNGYSEIVPGRRGAAEELIPLPPDYVTPEQQIGGVWRSDCALTKGPIRYKLRQQDGTERILSDENVFHLRGMSSGGLKGLSVIEYARQSFGLALATEQYGARWFSQDARPRGVLKTANKLQPETKRQLKEGWEAAHSGLGNAHRIAVLEDGLEFQAISISPEDSQFLGTRDFQIADIARWFRVPLHMIQAMTKETAWGTGIESLSLAFVIYTLQPWAVRWEQAIRRDLINDTRRYYAKHTFAGLLRGDTKSRFEAYSQARNWGWLSTDEIRAFEEMNPLPDGKGAIYLQPLNMVEAGTPPPPVAPASPDNSARNNAHYDLLLRETAARIIRKETVALSKAAKRCASDTEAWRTAIDEFYVEHAGYVAQTLRVDAKLAAWYCGEQRVLLLEHGVAAMEDWEARRIEDLIAMVQGGAG